MAINPRISISDFEAFLAENQEPGSSYELINGEIFSVTSNLYSSMIAAKILGAIFVYLESHPIGGVSGEQGGYEISEDTVIAPDVAFISNTKLATLSKTGFHPQPPDFAVEVVSPSDLKNPRRIRKKLALYQRIKIPLLWMVYEERKSVEVYENGTLTRTAGIDDMLDGGTVLPGFTLVVAKFMMVIPDA